MFLHVRPLETFVAEAKFAFLANVSSFARRGSILGKQCSRLRAFAFIPCGRLKAEICVFPKIKEICLISGHFLPVTFRNPKNFNGARHVKIK